MVAAIDFCFVSKALTQLRRVLSHIPSSLLSCLRGFRRLSSRTRLLPNLLGVGASWGHDRSYYRMASPAPRALSPDYPRLNPRAPAPNLAAIAAPEIQLCPANRAFYQSFPNSPSYFFHYPSIIALEIFAAIYYDQDVSWG